MPPQTKNRLANLEFEQSVLGAILVRPEVLDVVSDRLAPEDFYQEAHGRIFRAMVDLQGRGEPVDLVTVSELLKERGALEGVVGPIFLAGLSEQVGFATNAAYYADKVKEKARLRSLREIGLSIAAGAEKGEDRSFLLDNFKERSRPASSSLRTITAKALAAKDFPPRRWVVSGLITEGLTILAGPPKAGKSWLALNIAAAVAGGGMALSKVQVEEGEVLYLALEDSERRLKERLEKIIPFGEIPESLHIATAGKFPPLHSGGLETLTAWFKEHSRTRLVIVDTLGRIKPSRKRNQDSYEHDTAIMGALQNIALEHGVALVVIHHTRKQGAEDFLQEVSGTFGLTGAADCVAVLSRKGQGQMDGVLKLTGRDIEEQELALKFDPNLGFWELLGEAYEYGMSKARQDIVMLLRENSPMKPAQVAKILEKNESTTRVLLWKMRDAGEIGWSNGEYFYKS